MAQALYLAAGFLQVPVCLLVLSYRFVGSAGWRARSARWLLMWALAASTLSNVFLFTIFAL